MLSFNKTIKTGERLLRACNEETRIATLLFEDLFHLNRADILRRSNDVISEDDYERYIDSIKRVCNGEPFQYVTGFSHFYGSQFKVTKDTLIPRNETEELVYLVLEKIKRGIVVDIGTGTGAIGLTLKKENPDLDVIMTDISKSALTVAKENMQKLGVNVTVLEGDMLTPLIEHNLKVDALVSNPPYIACDEVKYMSKSTLQHEPESALFASNDGLYFYEELIKGLDQVLNKDASVFFEIGFKQGTKVRDLFLSFWSKSEVVIIPDINGQDRIIYAKWVK